MGKKNKDNSYSAELRKRALKILHENPKALAELPKANIEHLAHELSVYQIELEMQNEHLLDTQTELERSRDEYRQLYDFAPVGYLSLSTKGIIEKANLTLSSMVGVDRAELLKHPFSKFILKEDMDKYYLHRKIILETKEQQKCELRIKRKDGSTFWAYARCRPVMDQEGEIIEIRSIISDISERKQFEEELQKKQNYANSIISTLRESLVVLDKDLRVVSAGRSFYTTFHVSPDATEGQFLFNLGNHQWDIPELRKLLEQVLPEKTTIEEYEITHNFEGIGEKTMLLNARKIIGKELKEDLILLAIEDITDRKKAEHKLEIAKEHAEAANIAKSQFLADMSHEIRTPMTVITGFCRMLMTEGLTDEQMMYAEHIQNAGISLLNIINDILDFSKIEAGKLEVEPKEYLLKKNLDNIDTMMRPLAEKKDLEFKVICGEKLPAVILTDEGRLRQCLINLVSNAIKFTHEGYVHLNVSLEKRDSKAFIRFEVEDTGIGIPRDKQEHIFESFTQAEKGSARKYGGTGLGLSITNQLAGLLGGQVSLTSQEGKGSIFSLTIPVGLEVLPEPSLEEREPVHEITPTEKEEPVYSGKVLVAEDDEGIRYLIDKILQRLGLEVTTANDGKEAVEKALAASFDLIFMDVRMPHMDGFEAMETLHQKEITTPIVALTAHAMEGYSKICLQAGYDDYLSKPIEHEQLLQILDRYLPTITTVGS